MALKLLMRGGIYLLFVVGVAIRWLFRRLKSKDNPLAQDDMQTIISKDNAIEYLDSRDWHKRLSAINLLADNPEARHIPALAQHLNDPIYDIREALLLALIAHGQEAVPSVIEMLETGKLETRETAIRILAQLPTSASIAAIEQTLLQDESAWVRLPAVEALAKIGDTSSIATLIDALEDRHPDVYDAVVVALEKVGTADALEAIQNHPYKDVDKRKKRKGLPEDELIELS